jgi:hypothetical protein
MLSSCSLYAHSIIAITGLDGHAYGSWRGKGNLGRMWLRDFLSKDLPHCRTMIYGYNSKLTSHGVDTIMDYSRGLMEELKKVRGTNEVSRDTSYCGKRACVRKRKADRHNLLATTATALLRRAQLRWHHTRSCRSHTHGATGTWLSSCAVPGKGSPDNRRRPPDHSSPAQGHLRHAAIRHPPPRARCRRHPEDAERRRWPPAEGAAGADQAEVGPASISAGRLQEPGARPQGGQLLRDGADAAAAVCKCHKPSKTQEGY